MKLKFSEISENYLHEELRFKSGHKMELDLFIPNLNLAFEYQGEQHYYDVYAMGPQWQYSMRDEEKRHSCHQKGITLIEIPYWWDFQRASIQATIYEFRPDLIKNPGSGKPIPKEPPQGWKSKPPVYVE